MLSVTAEAGLAHRGTELEIPADRAPLATEGESVYVTILPYLELRRFHRTAGAFLERPLQPWDPERRLIG